MQSSAQENQKKIDQCELEQKLLTRQQKTGLDYCPNNGCHKRHVQLSAYQKHRILNACRKEPVPLMDLVKQAGANLIYVNPQLNWHENSILKILASLHKRDHLHNV